VWSHRVKRERLGEDRPFPVNRSKITGTSRQDKEVRAPQVRKNRRCGGGGGGNRNVRFGFVEREKRQGEGVDEKSETKMYLAPGGSDTGTQGKKGGREKTGRSESSDVKN